MIFRVGVLRHNEFYVLLLIEAVGPGDESFDPSRGGQQWDVLNLASGNVFRADLEWLERYTDPFVAGSP